MSIRVPLAIAMLLIAVMAAASLWGLHAIPEGTHVAVHWGLNGKPNGFASKDKALVLIPAIGAGLTALLALIPWIEPRHANLIASRKFYVAGWIGVLLLLTLMHVLLVMAASGFPVDMPAVATAAVALLIVVLGNFMGKTRSTFMLGGLRLPWTLTSEMAWEKGNRLTGRLYVATGLATLAGSLFADAKIATVILVAGIILSVLAGGIASYVVWRRDPDRQTGDADRL